MLSLDGRWLDGQVVRQGGATSILRRCHQALGLAASNDEIPRPPELPLVEGKNGTGPSGVKALTLIRPEFGPHLATFTVTICEC